MKEILCLLSYSSIKSAKHNYKKKELKDSAFREAVATIRMKKRGAKNKLLPDEETLLVATAEMKAMASQPQMVVGLSKQIFNVVTALELSQTGVSPSKHTKHKSKLAFARQVINRVNKREPGHKKGCRMTKTGCVKVGGLSNKRAKQSDPRLGWIMFHNI